jgi:hypothetical protein
MQLYQPWTPTTTAQSMKDYHQLPPHKLSEHQAVLSVLFALRGSHPQAPPALTGLPGLGSKPLRDVQEQANALLHRSDARCHHKPLQDPLSCPGLLNISVSSAQHRGLPADDSLELRTHQLYQQQQQAAAERSWVSASAAALQLLDCMQTNAAAAAAAGSRDGWCPGVSQATNEAAAAASFSGSAPTPLVDAVAKVLHLASAPVNLQMLEVKAGKHSLSSASAPAGAADQRLAMGAVSAAGAAATEAVAAAESVQPAVLPLIMLAASEPGTGLQMPQPLQQPSAPTSRRLVRCAGGTGGPQQKQEHSVYGKPIPDCVKQLHDLQHKDQGLENGLNAVQGEEALVNCACLAVQGMYSAVDQLWEEAVSQQQQQQQASRMCIR